MRRRVEQRYSLQYYGGYKEYVTKGTILSKSIEGTSDIWPGLYPDGTEMLTVNPINVSYNYGARI